MSFRSSNWGKLFQVAPWKAILVVAGVVAIAYCLWAYIDGVRLQVSSFDQEFGDLVNRNLLAPWDPDDERFAITTGVWCQPGAEPGWPKTRRQCALVGGAIEGCSIFTYGRSCAVIGVPKIYFDDKNFRESLRVALSDLCATFRAEKRPRKLPSIYHFLDCSGGAIISLSVYIRIRDSIVVPPYKIQRGSKLVALGYFSRRTREIVQLREISK